MFCTAETPMSALSSQNRGPPRWCILLAKYSLQTLTVISKEWKQLTGWLDGWIYLTSGWHQAHLAPFLHYFQHNCCGVHPTSRSLVHDHTYCTHMVMLVRVNTHGRLGLGNTVEKKDIWELTHLLSEWFLQPDPCWLFLFALFRPEQQADCSLGESCAGSRNLTASLPSVLRRDLFHHSAIGLGTFAGWQKVCRAETWLGTGYLFWTQVLGSPQIVLTRSVGWLPLIWHGLNLNCLSLWESDKLLTWKPRRFRAGVVGIFLFKGNMGINDM